MRVIAGVFAVSVIAIMSVIPARAEIVSTELLNKRLGTEGNLATVAHTGSYTDLTNKPTIPAAANDATLDIQKNGTSVGTFTANASTNKTINITVPTGALASKSTVTSADITDGTITTIDISATAGIKKGQLAADVQTSLDKANTALQAHQNISGKEDKSNIVKSTDAVDTLKTSETRYPSMAAANKLAHDQAQAAVAGASASYQVKSTGDFQMGNAGGGWTTMSTDQQNALNSGITSGKVATYDGYATTIASKQDKSTAVTHAENTAAGDSTHPVYVNAAGVATKIDKVAAAEKADTATSATNDSSGHSITATYATKSEMNAVKSTAEGKQDALTQTQLNAVNSGITSGKVTTYDGYATTIASKQDKSTAVTHTENTAVGDSTHPVYVNADGVATKIDKVDAAVSADSATKAFNDSSGNYITTTYATKDELTNGLAGKQGTLKAGSNISIAADGTISATDTNTTYGAAGTGLGLVKSGGVATVSGGQITAVSKATNADNATNATTATNAKKICSGSTCTAFVDIWVE